MFNDRFIRVEVGGSEAKKDCYSVAYECLARWMYIKDPGCLIPMFIPIR